MKLIHLSDLHLGKRVNEFPMLEDQRYILERILHIVDDEKPDGVLIAGDVYDKSMPPAEAVELLDEFLVGLSMRGLQVYIISGNHDSPERLAFGGRLMDTSGIHLAPVYRGTVAPLELQDEYGTVYVYMLPFLKPSHMRQFYQDEAIETYTDAMRIAVREMRVVPSERNILVTHQFVTGAARCDSEDISVGGTDNVDASVFAGFDYVALGHLHGAQDIEKNRIRYCGTPLKYSFSEASHQKSVTVVELREKGAVSIRTAPLHPRRDLIELKGTYDDLTRKSFYENTSYREDYVHITLTDEKDVMDAVAKLRVIYHNLMKLDYDNTRTRHQIQIDGAQNIEARTPLDLFSEFYRQQNGSLMTPEQTEFVCAMIEKIWEE